MTQTTIRGMQLRDASIARSKVDAAFEANLTLIESNIASIFSTMSTDAERMAAVEALTTAFQNADGTLQGMITSMVNATRAGAGLEADGSVLYKGVLNYVGINQSLRAAIETLDAALKTEELARVAGDAALTSSLQAVIDAGATAAQTNLDNEIAARTAADALLTTNLATETAARIAADADLQTQVNNEVIARTNLNTALSDAIAAEATARTNAVSAEASTRATADTALQNNIDAEALARTTADGVHTASITQEITDRAAADAAEAAARAAADTALDGRVTTIEQASVNFVTYAKVVKREAPAGVIDGVNTLFTVAFDVVAGTEDVYYNGQLLDKGADADYTMVGKEITLAFAPVGTDKVRVSYFR